MCVDEPRHQVSPSAQQAFPFGPTSITYLKIKHCLIAANVTVPTNPPKYDIVNMHRKGGSLTNNYEH